MEHINSLSLRLIVSTSLDYHDLILIAFSLGLYRRQPELKRQTFLFCIAGFANFLLLTKDNFISVQFFPTESNNEWMLLIVSLSFILFEFVVFMYLLGSLCIEYQLTTCDY